MFFVITANKFNNLSSFFYYKFYERFIKQLIIIIFTNLREIDTREGL
jgi:hypothetical protein